MNDEPGQYRVYMHSVPGTWAWYEGFVDVWADDEASAIAAALSKLRRTSFPDRSYSAWTIDRVELLP